MGDRRKYVTRREQKLLVVRVAKVSIKKRGDDPLPENKRRVPLKSQISSSIVAREVAPANKKATPAQISGEQSFW